MARSIGRPCASSIPVDAPPPPAKLSTIRPSWRRAARMEAGGKGAGGGARGAGRRRVLRTPPTKGPRGGRASADRPEPYDEGAGGDPDGQPEEDAAVLDAAAFRLGAGARSAGEAVAVEGGADIDRAIGARAADHQVGEAGRGHWAS